MRPHVLLLCAVTLGAAACSSGGGDVQPTSVDFGGLPLPSGDLAGVSLECAGGCPQGMACSSGKCITLPATCPCPPGSYCDLASNACKPGCIADDQCGAGQYCDPAKRACQPGCRADTDCKLAEQCQQHICVDNCPVCDDGNPCTDKSCERGVCKAKLSPNGTACPDDGNPCTTDLCMSGHCYHQPGNEGAACPSTKCMTNAACHSGMCSGPSLPDGTSCGATDYDLCLAGACKSAKALCTTTMMTGYITSTWNEPSGATGPQVYYSCQCPTATSMKMDWPPGATGSGGVPRFWSCTACKPTLTSGQTACY
jgi:hypothetical protein